MGKKERLRATFDYSLKTIEFHFQSRYAFLGAGVLVIATGATILIVQENIWVKICGTLLMLFGAFIMHDGSNSNDDPRKLNQMIPTLIEKM